MADLNKKKQVRNLIDGYSNSDLLAQNCHAVAGGQLQPFQINDSNKKTRTYRAETGAQEPQVIKEEKTTNVNTKYSGRQSHLSRVSSSHNLLTLK